MLMQSFLVQHSKCCYNVMAIMQTTSYAVFTCSRQVFVIFYFRTCILSCKHTNIVFVLAFRFIGRILCKLKYGQLNFLLTWLRKFICYVHAMLCQIAFSLLHCMSYYYELLRLHVRMNDDKI